MSSKKRFKFIFILFLTLFACKSKTKENHIPEVSASTEKEKVEQQYKMKSLDELIDIKDPAFPILENLISNATNKVEVLPRNLENAEECLLSCQVTTRSFMGAIIYHTGGLLIDNGWLRILGSGGDRLTRSIASWNKDKTYTESMAESKFLLIADDAVGGFFAINAGALGNNVGSVYYFAPETLEWLDLEISYSDFISFALSGKVDQFYESLRWQGWEDDVKKLSPDEAFSFYPFLWTKEGRNINNNTKEIVSISEIYTFNQDSRKQLNNIIENSNKNK